MLGTLHTTDEFAQFIRKDRDTVLQLVQQGEVEAYLIGDEYLFSKEQIAEYLQRQRVPKRGDSVNQPRPANRLGTVSIPSQEDEEYVELKQLVQKALDSISKPWTPDITDQVCLAIERNQDWHQQYDELVRRHGKAGVNSHIGRFCLTLTGLRNLGERRQAKSKLISTYTRLG
ncbi:MAG: hypothetical protein CYG59_23990 [Chloroflexi bacterium]|nr:MAG: hypothetical protein CYG59_23990 [Chloroflexota bacterium]